MRNRWLGVTGLVLILAALILDSVGPRLWPAAYWGNARWGMPGPGMMGSGMMSPGMMGGMMGAFNRGAQQNVPPLALDEARAAVELYLRSLGIDNLAVGEIMIFDNHAYAQVIDRSGSGAFEVLVDPATRAVYPEPGPNMMWNIAYGHMGGAGMMGMLRGQQTGAQVPGSAVTMPVGDDQAIELAQRYVDSVLPGAVADDEVDTFPGYRTLDILRDDQPIGMLSVNGYDGQVWPHTWHGTFIEMSETH